MLKRLPSTRRDQPTHVVVVVRLTVDPYGQVTHGEVVDGTAQPWGRFRDWDGLIRCVKAFLVSLCPVEDVTPVAAAPAARHDIPGCERRTALPIREYDRCPRVPGRGHG